MRKNRRRAMTLLEVLLVVAILGVIAALVAPRLIGRQKQANVDATKLSIDGLSHALKLYAVDHDGEYPTTAQGVRALYERPGSDKNWKGPYLDVPARDAWGNRFEYRYPGVNNIGGFDLSSAGADGLPGSEDDVNNWGEKDLY